MEELNEWGLVVFKHKTNKHLFYRDLIGGLIKLFLLMKVMVDN